MFNPIEEAHWVLLLIVFKSNEITLWQFNYNFLDIKEENAGHSAVNYNSIECIFGYITTNSEKNDILKWNGDFIALYNFDDGEDNRHHHNFHIFTQHTQQSPLKNTKQKEYNLKCFTPH